MTWFLARGGLPTTDRPRDAVWTCEPGDAGWTLIAGAKLTEDKGDYGKAKRGAGDDVRQPVRRIMEAARWHARQPYRD